MPTTGSMRGASRCSAQPTARGWFRNQSSLKSVTYWSVKAAVRSRPHFCARSDRAGFTLAPLTPADTDRMAELVETYADFPLGGVDAAVIAIAERLEVPVVATLDLRHFTVVKPQHVSQLGHGYDLVRCFPASPRTARVPRASSRRPRHASVSRPTRSTGTPGPVAWIF